MAPSRALTLGLLILALGPGTAPGQGAALVIDDLGNARQAGERALALPGPVAYGVLPHAPHSRALARAAHRAGREVILHLPMESSGGNALGPGGLRSEAGTPELVRRLYDALAAVPYAVGVSNHMGSRFTRERGAVEPVMREILHVGGLFFLDSRTTALTVGCSTARRLGVPTLERDVFIDADASPAAIRYEIERWRRLARRPQGALAIGHPYPQTLALLEEALSEPGDGVPAVSVGALLAHREEQSTPCRTFSSPSPTVARN